MPDESNQMGDSLADGGGGAQRNFSAPLGRAVGRSKPVAPAPIGAATSQQSPDHFCRGDRCPICKLRGERCPKCGLPFDAPADAVADLESYGDPEHWWVTDRPTKAILDD